MKISCVDLYCGIGGLTYGLEQSGINVVAGIDIDESCSWSYESNTKSKFLNLDLANIDSKVVEDLFDDNCIRLLAGCAPCQPFSSYGRTRKGVDERWVLLNSFSSIINDVKPEVVTMENVSGLVKHPIFDEFVASLKKLGYLVDWEVLSCEKYGVPQKRKRLVLIASLIGDVLLPKPTAVNPVTVRDAIKHLTPIQAGCQDQDDRLHVSSSLSSLNLERIKHSKPSGTWRDWPTRLITKCHKKHSGKTYSSVYGRMSWDFPSPTITTQCYGYGNGRFGHPEQDRAISLREAAILQSFPDTWQFLPQEEPIYFTSIGRAIGNAVPPLLGKAIGETIIKMTADN